MEDATVQHSSRDAPTKKDAGGKQGWNASTRVRGKEGRKEDTASAQANPESAAMPLKPERSLDAVTSSGRKPLARRPGTKQTQDQDSAGVPAGTAAIHTPHRQTSDSVHAAQSLSFGRSCQSESSTPVSGPMPGGSGVTPSTPMECVSMIEAMENATLNAPAPTPGANLRLGTNLDSWLEGAGLKGSVATPARQDLAKLWDKAAEAKALKAQMAAMREAELDLANQEVEEIARNFGMLEEENLELAAANHALEERLAELEFKGVSGSSSMAADEAEGLLRQANESRRMSDMYQAQQVESFRLLNEAEQQLEAMQADRLGSSQEARLVSEQRLLEAQAQVQAAAEAAETASQQLHEVLGERERLKRELELMQIKLAGAEGAQEGRAGLSERLKEAYTMLRDEKAQHSAVTQALVEHASQLSHKYQHLSEHYDTLSHKYGKLKSANEGMAAQLKEAHEALYDMRGAVERTPPAVKRKKDEQLRAAHEAIYELEQQKAALEARLHQALNFMQLLSSQQQQQGALAAAAATQPIAQPITTAAPAAAAAAAAATLLEAEAEPSFNTPVRQRSNPLFGTATGSPSPAVAPAAAATFSPGSPAPLSPLLAAAVADGAAPEQQLQAAGQELRALSEVQASLEAGLAAASSTLAQLAGELKGSHKAAGVAKAAASKAGSMGGSHARSGLASKGDSVGKAGSVGSSRAGSISGSNASSAAGSRAAGALKAAAAPEIGKERSARAGGLSAAPAAPKAAPKAAAAAATTRASHAGPTAKQPAKPEVAAKAPAPAGGFRTAAPASTGKVATVAAAINSRAAAGTAASGFAAAKVAPSREAAARAGAKAGAAAAAAAGVTKAGATSSVGSVARGMHTSGAAAAATAAKPAVAVAAAKPAAAVAAKAAPQLRKSGVTGAPVRTPAAISIAAAPAVAAPIAAATAARKPGGAAINTSSSAGARLSGVFGAAAAKSSGSRPALSASQSGSRGSAVGSSASGPRAAGAAAGKGMTATSAAAGVAGKTAPAGAVGKGATATSAGASAGRGMTATSAAAAGPAAAKGRAVAPAAAKRPASAKPLKSTAWARGSVIVDKQPAEAAAAAHAATPSYSVGSSSASVGGSFAVNAASPALAMTPGAASSAAGGQEFAFPVLQPTEGQQQQLLTEPADEASHAPGNLAQIVTATEAAHPATAHQAPAMPATSYAASSASPLPASAALDLPADNAATLTAVDGEISAAPALAMVTTPTPPSYAEATAMRSRWEEDSPAPHGSKAELQQSRADGPQQSSAAGQQQSSFVEQEASNTNSVSVSAAPTATPPAPRARVQPADGTAVDIDWASVIGMLQDYGTPQPAAAAGAAGTAAAAAAEGTASAGQGSGGKGSKKAKQPAGTASAGKGSGGKGSKKAKQPDWDGALGLLASPVKGRLSPQLSPQLQPAQQSPASLGRAPVTSGSPSDTSGLGPWEPVRAVTHELAEWLEQQQELILYSPKPATPAVEPQQQQQQAEEGQNVQQEAEHAPPQQQQQQQQQDDAEVQQSQEGRCTAAPMPVTPSAPPMTMAELLAHEQASSHMGLHGSAGGDALSAIKAGAGLGANLDGAEVAAATPRGMERVASNEFLAALTVAAAKEDQSSTPPSPPPSILPLPQGPTPPSSLEAASVVTAQLHTAEPAVGAQPAAAAIDAAAAVADAGEVVDGANESGQPAVDAVQADNEALEAAQPAADAVGAVANGSDVANVVPSSPPAAAAAQPAAAAANAADGVLSSAAAAGQQPAAPTDSASGSGHDTSITMLFSEGSQAHEAEGEAPSSPQLVGLQAALLAPETPEASQASGTASPYVPYAAAASPPIAAGAASPDAFVVDGEHLADADDQAAAEAEAAAEAAAVPAEVDMAAAAGTPAAAAAADALIHDMLPPGAAAPAAMQTPGSTATAPGSEARAVLTDIATPGSEFSVRRGLMANAQGSEQISLQPGAAAAQDSPVAGWVALLGTPIQQQQEEEEEDEEDHQQQQQQEEEGNSQQEDMQQQQQIAGLPSLLLQQARLSPVAARVMGLSSNAKSSSFTDSPCSREVQQLRRRAAANAAVAAAAANVAACSAPVAVLGGLEEDEWDAAMQEQLLAQALLQEQPGRPDCPTPGSDYSTDAPDNTTPGSEFSVRRVLMAGAKGSEQLPLQPTDAAAAQDSPVAGWVALLGTPIQQPPREEEEQEEQQQQEEERQKEQSAGLPSLLLRHAKMSPAAARVMGTSSNNSYSGGSPCSREVQQLRRRAAANAAAAAAAANVVACSGDASPVLPVSVLVRQAYGAEGADGAAAALAALGQDEWDAAMQEQLLAQALLQELPDRPTCPTPGSDYSIDVTDANTPTEEGTAVTIRGTDAAALLVQGGGVGIAAEVTPVRCASDAAALAALLGSPAVEMAGAAPGTPAAAAGAAAGTAGATCPSTGGAVLDRGAHSLLLSPSVQLGVNYALMGTEQTQHGGEGSYAESTQPPAQQLADMAADTAAGEGLAVQGSAAMDWGHVKHVSMGSYGELESVALDSEDGYELNPERQLADVADVPAAGGGVLHDAAARSAAAPSAEPADTAGKPGSAAWESDLLPDTDAGRIAAGADMAAEAEEVAADEEAAAEAGTETDSEVERPQGQYAYKLLPMTPSSPASSILSGWAGEGSSSPGPAYATHSVLSGWAKEGSTSSPKESLAAPPVLGGLARDSSSSSPKASLTTPSVLGGWMGEGSSSRPSLAFAADPVLSVCATDGSSSSNSMRSSPRALLAAHPVEPSPYSTLSVPMTPSDSAVEEQAVVLPGEEAGRQLVSPDLEAGTPSNSSGSSLAMQYLQLDSSPSDSPTEHRNHNNTSSDNNSGSSNGSGSSNALGGADAAASPVAANPGCTALPLLVRRAVAAASGCISGSAGGTISPSEAQRGLAVDVHSPQLGSPRAEAVRLVSLGVSPNVTPGDVVVAWAAGSAGLADAGAEAADEGHAAAAEGAASEGQEALAVAADQEDSEGAATEQLLPGSPDDVAAPAAMMSPPGSPLTVEAALAALNSTTNSPCGSSAGRGPGVLEASLAAIGSSPDSTSPGSPTALLAAVGISPGSPSLVTQASFGDHMSTPASVTRALAGVGASPDGSPSLVFQASFGGTMGIGGTMGTPGSVTSLSASHSVGSFGAIGPVSSMTALSEADGASSPGAGSLAPEAPAAAAASSEAASPEAPVPEAFAPEPLSPDAATPAGPAVSLRAHALSTCEDSPSAFSFGVSVAGGAGAAEDAASPASVLAPAAAGAAGMAETIEAPSPASVLAAAAAAEADGMAASTEAAGAAGMAVDVPAQANASAPGAAAAAHASSTGSPTTTQWITPSSALRSYLRTPSDSAGQSYYRTPMGTMPTTGGSVTQRIRADSSPGSPASPQQLRSMGSMSGMGGLCSPTNEQMMVVGSPPTPSTELLARLGIRTPCDSICTPMAGRDASTPTGSISFDGANAACAFDSNSSPEATSSVQAAHGAGGGVAAHPVTLSPSPSPGPFTPTATPKPAQQAATDSAASPPGIAAASPAAGASPAFTAAASSGSPMCAAWQASPTLSQLGFIEATTAEAQQPHSMSRQQRRQLMQSASPPPFAGLVAAGVEEDEVEVGSAGDYQGRLAGLEQQEEEEREEKESMEEHWQQEQALQGQQQQQQEKDEAQQDSGGGEGALGSEAPGFGRQGDAGNGGAVGGEDGGADAVATATADAAAALASHATQTTPLPKQLAGGVDVGTMQADTDMEDKGTQVTPSIVFYGLAQYNRPDSMAALDNNDSGGDGTAVRQLDPACTPPAYSAAHRANVLADMLGDDTPER